MLLHPFAAVGMNLALLTLNGPAAGGASDGSRHLEGRRHTEVVIMGTDTLRTWAGVGLVVLLAVAPLRHRRRRFPINRRPSCLPPTRNLRPRCRTRCPSP